MLGIEVILGVTAGGLFAEGLKQGAKALAGQAGKQLATSLTSNTMSRLGGHFGLPANHDAARAIRNAQLNSLQNLLSDYSKHHAPDWHAEGGHEPGLFLDRSRKFVNQQIGLCLDLTLKMNETVEREIERAFDSAIAGAPTLTLAARADGLRRAAERAVLEELHAGIRKTPEDSILVPQSFRAAFSGEVPGVAGWFDGFVRFANEAIKAKDGRFFSIFAATRLGAIAELGLDTNLVVRGIEARAAEIDGKLDQQLEVAERTERKVDALHTLVEQFMAERAPAMSHETGVPVATLRAIVEAFDEQHQGLVDAEQIEQFLRQRAGEYRALKDQLGRLSNDDPGVTGARQKAQQAIDEGRFDHAREILLGALARQRRAREELEDLARQRRASEAETCVALADLALLGSRFQEAASYFDGAAALVDDADTRWRYTMRAAEALYWLGSGFGDRAVLTEALGRYHKAMQTVPESDRLASSMHAAHKLGLCLVALGRHEAGTGSLEKAVAVYREALKARAGAPASLVWADVLYGLGVGLSDLGNNKRDSKLLSEAVSVFRDALEESFREGDFQKWAQVQNDLGVALFYLDAFVEGTACLEEAVSVHHKALRIRTREASPFNWAQSQHNLGQSLCYLGIKRNDGALLQDAVGVLRQALTIRTHEYSPRMWALTQEALGKALHALGVREQGVDSLQDAMVAYGHALEQQTQDRAPLRWASCRASLLKTATEYARRSGDASTLLAVVSGTLRERRFLLDLPGWTRAWNDFAAAVRTTAEIVVRNGDAGPLDQALALLEEITTEKMSMLDPPSRAPFYVSLGWLMTDVGLMRTDPGHLNKAVAVLRGVLDDDVRAKDPATWLTGQTALARALPTLGLLTGDKALVVEGVECCRTVLALTEPDGRGQILDCLARVLYMVGVQEENASMLREARATADELVIQRPRNTMPELWASAESLVGSCLSAIGQCEGDLGLVEEAVGRFRQALEEQTRERAAFAFGGTQVNLAFALKFIGEQKKLPALVSEAVDAFGLAAEALGASPLGEAARAGLAESRELLAALSPPLQQPS